MSTYNRERYHTPEGKARQKKANQRYAMRHKLAWVWLTENRPDVINEIIDQIKKENQQ